MSHVPCNIDRFVEMLLWLEFWAPFFEPEPDLNWGAVLMCAGASVPETLRSLGPRACIKGLGPRDLEVPGPEGLPRTNPQINRSGNFSLHVLTFLGISIS